LLLFPRLIFNKWFNGAPNFQCITQPAKGWLKETVFIEAGMADVIRSSGVCLMKRVFAQHKQEREYGVFKSY